MQCDKEFRQTNKPVHDHVNVFFQAINASCYYPDQDNMKNATHLIFSAALALAIPCPPAFAKDERPNVVLILTDDQGYGDLRSTGNDEIDTPSLDRLAKESTRFERFLVSPICTMTRAS